MDETDLAWDQLLSQITNHNIIDSLPHKQSTFIQ